MLLVAFLRVAVVGCVWRVGCCRLCVVCGLLFWCLLFAVCCFPLCAWYLVFGLWYSVVSVRGCSFVVCCLLFGACSLLIVVCCFGLWSFVVCVWYSVFGL